MDFGEANLIRSMRLNQYLLIIKSERKLRFSYKFHKKNETQFACALCKKLGKSRIVTVRDGRIVSTKHPEDDHHSDCQPVAEVEIDVLDIDRKMRAEVQRAGKRPSEADTDLSFKKIQVFRRAG